MTVAAAAIGAAVTVGTTAYAVNQSNKRAKAASGGLNEAVAYARANPSVFGEKLDFENLDYSPLFRDDPGYANIAGDTISGNQRNLPAALQLTGDTNRAITAGNLERIRGLDPTFDAATSQQQQNTLALLRGEIPFEDRNALTGRRAEAAALGGTGANPQQVAADLGLTRLDLMSRGAANLTNNVTLWDAIDPVSRQLLPQSMFVDVGQAVSQAVAENQFAANFAQAERAAELNYAMMPDPQKAGLLNLMAGRAGLQAANPQQSVLGNALVAGVNTGFSAYNANQAAQQYQQRQYVPTDSAALQRTYATPQDQTLGITSLSGTNGQGVQTAYNPNTNAQYGQQGGLWSYFAQPRKN